MNLNYMDSAPDADPPTDLKAGPRENGRLETAGAYTIGQVSGVSVQVQTVRIFRPINPET